MNRVRIWDLPLRLFHWLLAAAFLSAFVIATLADDEGPLFAFHAILGLLLLLIVALRVVWGLIGSRWSRFRTLKLGPSALLRYLRAAFTRKDEARSAGHNPATAWFLLATVAIISGLGITGFLMARGNESVEEIHEVLAWSMIVLVALHIAGIVWHRLRHRENLAVGMVTGYKNADASAAVASARPWSAVAFLALIAVWGSTLLAGYDQVTGRLTLPLLNAPLQLAEIEGTEGANSQTQTSTDEREREEHHHEDEEDD